MDLKDLPYLLEPMRLEDLPTVSAIEREVFSLPWSIQAFRQEILYHDTAAYLVLRYNPPHEKLRRPWGTRQDPSLLGYGEIWMIWDEAHVCTLAVRPGWRGKGLGELLLAALIERALEQNASIVTLEVRVSNVVAQNLYRKYGLEVVGRRIAYYPDNQEDALIMSTPPIQTPSYQQAYKARVQALLARLRREAHPLASNRDQQSEQ